MNPKHPDLRRARIYDDVAETYERVNVPRMFAAPGRVLAEAVAPARGARVLDVGAGTGAVARAAREAAGDDALVVAADASAGMLHAARSAGLNDCVVAMLPDLPFASAAFDVVTSAFVLTHLDDADLAAHEMKRVLRPGGKVGLSAWYPGDDDAAREWSRVVREHIDPPRLEAAVRETLPGDDRFARPGSLSDLLAAAGFEAIVARDHRVECAMTVDEYVASREVCATGRALRALLTPDQWQRCRDDARAALSARFPGSIRFSRGFHTAVGSRPF